MDLSSLYRRVGTHLAAWGTLAVLVGAALAVWTGPFSRAIGIQAIVWGAIDFALGIAAIQRAARLRRRDPDEVFELRQTLRLRRILVVNARLDVLYVMAGGAMAWYWWSNPAWAGTGVGIMIQGLFLLGFDSAHAAALPKQPPAWYDERL